MLTLALETSTATFAAALGDGDRLLARRDLAGVRPADRDLPGLVAALLADAGRRFGELERVAVDVGPGNLTAVRTGVAYGNGLAFALGLPVATADSLELMAEAAGRPALCLRNAGGGRAYAALFGATADYRHGPLAAVVATDAPEVAVAGDFRSEVAELLPGTVVKDTGITGPDVATLLALTAGRPTVDPTRERAAHPLTDTSALFGGTE
jgi:tRNA threonylcarbamoyl adenosine modification protein YeaZ